MFKLDHQQSCINSGISFGYIHFAVHGMLHLIFLIYSVYSSISANVKFILGCIL